MDDLCSDKEIEMQKEVFKCMQETYALQRSVFLFANCLFFRAKIIYVFKILLFSAQREEKRSREEGYVIFRALHGMFCGVFI